MGACCDTATFDRACLRCTVTDTGVGIPLDRQRAIFDVFEQADPSSTRRFGGSGLGLAIAWQLVKMMQGQLDVSSAMGHGSTFSCTVVVGIADEGTEFPAIEASHVLRQTRILIVDGHLHRRNAFEEMLQSWEISSNSVVTAHAAIGLMYQAFKAGKPFHLVLLDSSLLSPDNVDLVKQIREDAQLKCPVVLLWADDDRLPADADCERLGIAESVAEPISQPKLLDAIQVALGPTLIESGDSCAVTMQLGPGAGPAKILLVEDSRINQMLAAAILRKHGHTVSIANNGRDALETLASQAFDLVLMDVQMPEMDGLEATRRMRENEKQTGKHLPIIALTAHALQGDRERCLAAGMDDYLPKPVHAGRISSHQLVSR